MEPKVKLMWATPDPEYMIIWSARISHNSEDKIDSRWLPTENAQSVMAGKGLRLDVPMVKVAIGKEDEALLRKLMTNQHNSTLRFAAAAFNISGVSRVCSHQLVRISNFGILQRSQRYCNEGESSFTYPDSLDETIDMKNFAEHAKAVYNDMIKAGVKEEDARYILPGASTTCLNMVSNFQGWKHMLKLRLNKKVQYETRLVASLLCEELYKLAPIVFESDYNKLDKIGL